MKTKIAILLAGLVLGSSGSALAVSGYWQKQGRTYFCQGVQGYVSCKTEGYVPRYGILIDNRSLIISFKNRVFFSCEVAYYPSSCWDFR